MAAIGGVATAFLGLGAVLGGILSVGLLKKGHQLNQQSKEIKSDWQGAAQYIKSFGNDAKKALKPIFDLQTGGIIEGFIHGGLGALHDFATMTSRLFPDIEGMLDRLGGVWDTQEPRFFSALENNIRTFLPTIEGFITWFLRKTPDAINFMTKMGSKLLPKMVRMFQAIGGAIKPFLPAGAALASILMDLVTIFFEAITPLSEITGMGLTPILQGLAWAVGLVADAVTTASNAISGFFRILNAWIGAIWDAMVNLDGEKLAGLLNNAVVTIFEALGNIILGAIEGLFNLIIKGMIDVIPGAKTALKTVNAVRKAHGKKPIPTSLNLPNIDLSKSKVDLRPDVPGKQTSPVKGRTKGEQPYVDNRTYNEYNTTVEGDSGMSGPQWRRAVERAYRGSKREEKLRNSNLRS